jgi:hypothetical protein
MNIQYIVSMRPQKISCSNPNDSVHVEMDNMTRDQAENEDIEKIYLRFYIA